MYCETIKTNLIFCDQTRIYYDFIYTCLCVCLSDFKSVEQSNFSPFISHSLLHSYWHNPFFFSHGVSSIAYTTVIRGTSADIGNKHDFSSYWETLYPYGPITLALCFNLVPFLCLCTVHVCLFPWFCRNCVYQHYDLSLIQKNNFKIKMRNF